MPAKSAAPAPTDEDILKYNDVPSYIASKYIGMSTPTMYSALRQGRVSFGFAVENEETHTWTYNISPGGLVKYNPATYAMKRPDGTEWWDGIAFPLIER